MELTDKILAGWGQKCEKEWVPKNVCAIPRLSELHAQLTKLIKLENTFIVQALFEPLITKRALCLALRVCPPETVRPENFLY
jgi:hypothetical protein